MVGGSVCGCARLTNGDAVLVALEMCRDFAFEVRRARSLGQTGGGPGRVGRLGESANLGERPTQCVEWSCFVGMGQGHGPRCQLQRLFAIAEARLGLGGQEPGEVVERFDPIRLEAKSLVKMLCGCCYLAAGLQDNSQLVVRLRVVWPESQGGLVMGFCPGRIAVAEQFVGEVIVRPSQVRVQP